MNQQLTQLRENLTKAGDPFISDIENIQDPVQRDQSMTRYLTDLLDAHKDMLAGYWGSPKVQSLCKHLYQVKWNKPWITGEITKGSCSLLTAVQLQVLKKMFPTSEGGDGLAELSNLTQIIKDESKQIKKYTTELINKYRTKVDLSTINRAEIDKMLDTEYQCYSVSQAYMILLNILFSTLKTGENESILQLSPEVKNWITNIVQLNVQSAQGFVFTNGFQFLDDNMIMKTSQDPKDTELIHEYFIGLYTNGLRQEIPNFMYVYGLFKCDGNLPLCAQPGTSNFMVSELVKGNSMHNMIKQGEMSYKDIFTAIAQVCLALQVAFNRFRFVHQDLHLKNVMIRPRRDKSLIKYTIGTDEVYILSDFTAVLIDFGFSSIRAENGQYYTVKKFERKWMNMDEKPGIDLFKMMIYLDAILNHPVISGYIHKAFTDLGITSLEKTQYFYPEKYDEKLVKLEPYQYLKSLLAVLPPDMQPDLYTGTPPKGYTVSGKDCPSIDSVLSRMDTLPPVSESCRGDPWKKLGANWRDKYGNKRYWFDCGKYHFDGSFNVITFPKGMSLYHGSDVLAYYNVNLPIGREYFDTSNNWIGADGIKFLKSNASDAEKEKLIEEKAPIGIGYYGDQEVAQAYSRSSGKCGTNCTFAFRLKQDATFVDLYDPFNIFVLIMLDPALTDQARQILQKANSITDLHDFKDLQDTFGPGFINLPKDKYDQLQQAFSPFHRFIVKSERGSLRNPDYLVPKMLSANLMKRGYAGFCNPRSPYITGKRIGGYRFAELVFGKDVMDYVERDFSNPFDWQYFDNKRLFGEIGKLIQDFKKYKTFNINFHQGDLYQHSVWTALFVQKQFRDRTEWAQYIPPEYMNLCVITGFLHDIGKGGDLVFEFYDKPVHPQTGYDYIMGTKPYQLEKGGSLDIPRLLQNVNIPINFQPVVAFLVLSHWEFGDHIRQMNGTNTDELAQKYVKTIQDIQVKTGISITDHNTNGILTAMSILIAVCDIMGSEAYMEPSKFDELAKKLVSQSNLVVKDLNVVVDQYPYLTNRPKVHRGSTNYKNFDIQTKGLQLRKAILAAVP
jgi:hypothetical protein